MSALAYLHLSPEQPLPELGGAPFRAVVVIEEIVADEWQHAVSAWLVEGGCLYMVAWGRDCSSWDDSVDWANLETFDFGEIPDDRFVMTTWHADETLAEVFWFAGHCAFHGDVDLERTLIVHIAAQARGDVLLAAYREAQFMEA